MTQRAFSLGAVLTVAHGRWLASFTEVSALVEHLTQQPCFPTDLALETSIACSRQGLLAQHPWLASAEMTAAIEDLDALRTTRAALANWGALMEGWLTLQRQRWGGMVEVMALGQSMEGIA